MGAVDKNRRENEKQVSRPIGLIPCGIFDAHDAVHKIGSDAIEEDGEQFDSGNPGEDGIKEGGASKKVPKRRRVADQVLSECNCDAVIQDVLIPNKVVIGHVPSDFPGKQPRQNAKRKKRDQAKQCKIELGFRGGV